MTQSGPQGVTSTRQNIRMEEEWPVRLPAATGISGHVVSFPAAALSNMGIGTDMLKGQSVFVLEKTAGGNPIAGYRFMVSENDTNTITLEECIYGTNKPSYIPTSAVGDWARIGVTTYGIIPGQVSQATVSADYEDPACERMWGVIDEADLPEGVRNISEEWAHGSRSMPRRHMAVFNQTDYALSYSMSVVDLREWTTLFNSTIDVASKLDAGPEDITLNVYPGDNEVTVANGATFSVGDYVSIGDHTGYAVGTDWYTTSTNTEIRKVVAVNGNVLVLDRPLKRIHLAANVVEVVREVHSDTYGHTGSDWDTDDQFIYHHLYIDDDIRPTTFTHMVVKKGEYDGTTVQDWILAYTGAQWSGLDMTSGTADQMMVDFKGACTGALLDPLDKDGSAIAAPTLDDEAYWNLDENPYPPMHWSQATVTAQINDGVTVELPFMEDMKVSVSRDLEAHHMHSVQLNSHRYSDGLKFGRDPIHFPGRVNFTTTLNIPLHNKRWSEALRDMHSVDVTASYVRNIGTVAAGTTVNSTMVLHVEDIRLSEAPLKLPSEAVEVQALQGLPGNVYIVMADKTPYYPCSFT